MIGIVGVISVGFLLVTVHHWRRFRKRRHPLSVVAAMLPLCGIAAALSATNDPEPFRSLTLAFCTVASIGTGAVVVLTWRAERLLRLEYYRSKGI